MTTFIKAKLKKADDQTNIEKYKVAANITEYHNKINLNFKIHNQVGNYRMQKCQNQYV